MAPAASADDKAAVTAPLGLLLATMEPLPGIELEFQRWYDAEHVPDRESTAGFETAARFVCLDGWPRYLALYDLSDVDVLYGPDYQKITRGNPSKWAGWIMPRVTGLLRAEGRQIYPGRARLGAEGAAARLALLRLKAVPADGEAAIVDALRTLYEPLPETLQLRVFRIEWEQATDIMATIELTAGHGSGPPAGLSEALGGYRRHIDLYNMYARYWRAHAGTPRPPS